ncbi:V-type ATPase subunit [Patescibacteria group bacterium]|nr:V-type ATPase subunit [Patescibacteria group bacterium]MBU4512025.1 V-type ATPase subunit [Patescibacteria group bacterium]MCG2693198.1 V-type ATPase subunit [Candidatus Parcubacteria bacterium]
MPYLTATGQIRVLEKKLLDATDIERMVDAKNTEQAFKVFSDTDLADNLLDVKMEEYGKALDDDLGQTKKFLEKATPNKDLVRLLFLEQDFHNIKLLLKQRYFELDLTGDLSNVGTIKADDLKAYVLNKENRNKKLETRDTDNADVSEIIDKMVTEFDMKKNDSNNPLSPSEIDLKLDKEYFELSLSLAKEIKNDFILDFTRRQIDVVNIRSLLRVKNLKTPSTDSGSRLRLEDLLVDGGQIELKKLSSFLEKDVDELTAFLKGYLTRSQEKFLQEYSEKKNLWQLEKGFDDLETDYIKHTKWMSYGSEIIFGYWYAKKNAARNVRLIMTGKLNNIPADEIKQRVRDIF